MELDQLINLPGMDLLLRLAPILGGALWLLLTTLLWKDGFNDLFEKLTRPRWKGNQRAQAAIMVPVRALMLTLAAALGAGVTTLGLLFNLAIILNIANAAGLLIGGKG